MVFNAIFNNVSVISWRSVLLMEETRVPGENHRHWQTLWWRKPIVTKYSNTKYSVHHSVKLVLKYTVELVQSNTWVFRHPVTSKNIYGPKVFLLTKIKPKYSDILYNPTHFPGPMICQIRQVLTSCTTHFPRPLMCQIRQVLTSCRTHFPRPLICQIRQVLTSCTTHFPGPLICQIRQVLTSCTTHFPCPKTYNTEK